MYRSKTSLDSPETKYPTDARASLTSRPLTEKQPDPELFPSDNLASAFRHSGWARQRRLVYESLRRTGQAPSRVCNFSACGFGAYVVRSPEPPYRYKVAGSACHDRFCQPCGRERAARIAANVLDKIDGDRVRFVTLTVRNREGTLGAGLAALRDGFKLIRRSSFWRNHVRGGVAFLEVKYNEQNDRWHPHFHCLVQGKYLPQKVLSAEWQRCTRDSPVVDVRLASGAECVTKYVTKYASKPLNTTFSRSSRHLDEAVKCLYGVRLATTFGSWRGVALIGDPDPEGWTPIGSLDTWLQRAAEGDVEALAVVTGLGERAARVVRSIARPPPREGDVCEPLIRPRQLDLIDCRTHVY